MIKRNIRGSGNREANEVGVERARGKMRLEKKERDRPCQVWSTKVRYLVRLHPKINEEQMKGCYYCSL